MPPYGGTEPKARDKSAAEMNETAKLDVVDTLLQL